MVERTKISGLPIQQEWTVVGVREGKLTDNPNGGQLQAYYVDFAGASDVYWRRKVPATVEVGKSYFGTISEGDHGPAFKKETPQGGGSGGASSPPAAAARTSSSGGRTFKPESQFDPEKVARMGRAHAQHMALLWLESIGDMPNELDELWGFVDAFEQDVNRAGAAAATADGDQSRNSTGQSGAAGPDVAAVVEAPEPEYVLKACEDAGLSGYPAGKLHGFVLRMLPEQQTRAVNGLADPQRQAETLAALKAAYLAKEGEELPPSDPDDDDIPF
jgi:hypothetical protein